MGHPRPRRINVKVTGKKSGKDHHFDHHWTAEDGHHQSGDIVCPANSGAHEITFDIHPDSDSNLAFLRDPADAIWISDQGCPTAAGNVSRQVSDIAVSPNGLSLTLINANSEAVDLHYRLRFQKIDAAGDHPEYDPVIKNNGGGGTGHG